MNQTQTQHITLTPFDTGPRSRLAMTVDRDAAAEALIHDGRRAYASKHYKNALECFTRALKRCSCSRGTRRERCTCKDFERVAADGGSIFNEAMYTCKCSVGQVFSKCDNALHIQALDYRAATFEALNELERAKKDAEWILELAPRLPEGYLRLGKIARLQKKSEFAWKVYSAGIDAGLSSNLTKDETKMARLIAAREPLHARYCRKDPMELPIDVVHQILSHVDFLTLLRCLQVCKPWRRALTSRENAHLWKTIELNKPIARRYPPNSHNLNKLFSYSGNDVRRLIIKDAAALRLNNSKIQSLLRRSRQLQYLEFHNELEPLSVDVHQWPPTLTHVVINEGHVPGTLWQALAENIQHLHINPKAPNSAAPQLQLPVLPKLRYLHIDGTLGMLRPTVLPVTLPSLEQLRFSNLFPFADYGLEGERTIKETFNRVWTGLKAVIVDSPSEILDLDQAFGLNSLVSINRGENIRYIEIAPWFNEHAGHTLIDRNRHSGELLSSSTGNGILGDLAQPNTFSNLEALRMKQTVMDGAALEPILQRSLANGKLRELDINFDTPGMNEAYGPASCRHLQSYDWLRGSASIRSMRVHNFRFTQHPRGDAELPLPSFLASLPNLEILEIGSSYYDEAELASIIVAVLKGCKNLKRVYQSYVKGWMLDGITVVAKERDIQLVFGERPREWPVGILD